MSFGQNSFGRVPFGSNAVVSNANVTVSISGQSISSAAGSLVANVANALTGQSVSAQQGAITGAINYALSGQSVSSAQGTLSSAINNAVTGQSASFSGGTVSQSLSVALLGTGISSSQGDVSVSGDKTVALTGQEITSYSGTLTASTGGDTQSGVSRLFAIEYYEKLIKEKREREKKEEELVLAERRAEKEKRDKKLKKKVITKKVEEAFDDVSPVGKEENYQQPNRLQIVPYQEAQPIAPQITIYQIVARIMHGMPSFLMPTMMRKKEVDVTPQVVQRNVVDELAVRRLRNKRDEELILLLAA